MPKLASFGHAVVTGIVIGIVVGAGSAQSHSTIANETNRNEGSGENSYNSNININSNSNSNSNSNIVFEEMDDANTNRERFNYSELSEYFHGADDTIAENEADPASPLPRPVFYVKESIWKNVDDNVGFKKSIHSGINSNSNSNSNSKLKESNTGEQDDGILSGLYRRLLQGYIDDNPAVDDAQFNPFGYSNYHKEEIDYHNEELVTDDDNLAELFDDDPYEGFDPTSQPTPIGSAFWDVLDEYVESSSKEEAFTTHFDSESESHSHSTSDSKSDSHIRDDSHDYDINSNSRDGDYYNDDQYFNNDSSRSSNSNSEDITDTDILFDHPENSIILRLSLGVVHYDAMMEDDKKDILGMTLRTMTKVLNKHSDIPFEVNDNLEAFEHKRGRNRKLKSEELFSSSSSNLDPQPQHRKARSESLAKILLEYVTVELGDQGWWEMSAIYTVWRNPRIDEVFFVYDDNELGDGDKGKRGLFVEEQARRRQYQLSSVKSRKILMQIEDIVDRAIEESIEEDVFWEALKTVRYGNSEMVLDQGIYYMDEMGIIDVKAVGDEYDMSELSCFMDRPPAGDALVCPEAARISKYPRADDDRIRPEKESPSFNINIDFVGTYPDVIAESLSEIEWGNREWAGLALMVSTILWTLLLSLTAHVVFAKRKRQVLWGAALTPTGVDDILNVGWRVYEQPSHEHWAQGPAPNDPPQQDLQQQQLFLQIFDKGQGQGYNDENSLLKGGVEQQQFAPPVATSTPPSPGPPQNNYDHNANGNIANQQHPP